MKGSCQSKTLQIHSARKREGFISGEILWIKKYLKWSLNQEGLREVDAGTKLV